jgi:hypothetical protein
VPLYGAPKAFVSTISLNGSYRKRDVRSPRMTSSTLPSLWWWNSPSTVSLSLGSRNQNTSPAWVTTSPMWSVDPFAKSSSSEVFSKTRRTPSSISPEIGRFSPSDLPLPDL